MKLYLACGFVLFAVACSSQPSTSSESATRVSSPPPAAAQPKLAGASAPALNEFPPAAREAAASILRDVSGAMRTTGTELQAQYGLPFKAQLGYDPLRAKHFDLVQNSSLKLTDSEAAVLAQRGFVISGRQRFPSYTYGYATIYAADLPVFISADSILDALHRSYDQLLVVSERELIRKDLEKLLSKLLNELEARPPSDTRRDLKLYLSVASALLLDRKDSPPPIAKWVDLAHAASGTAEIELFGTPRTEDFSQFKPRGHYTRDPELQSYFRAMMWLGRIDFRLVEMHLGKPRLRRPQVEAVVLLHSLFDSDLKKRFERIERILRLFVGESDNLTLNQLPALFAALKATSPEQLRTIDDGRLQRTILEHGLGRTQIASQLIEGGVHGAVMPNVSFMLLGQRYTVDSHVLSNVTWDRTAAKRMMPNPLDVAFAALANDQALSLLGSEVSSYAGELRAMRALIDARDDADWNSDLYNAWLKALRELSPNRETVANPRAYQMPAVTGTEAWGRRILGTQLASWAQLRHDTLLYAKQSYTSGALCEFPDVAVDPYPEFYAALERFARRGLALADVADDDAQAWYSSQIREYFTRLADASKQLRGIAEAQKARRPLDAKQLAFVNDAVVIKHEDAGCTTIVRPDGWYPKLFFQADPLEYDPTIADVHTQPTDEVGTPVGRVLHVGTTWPRTMIVTFEDCEGKPRAYVGLSSSYHEQITGNFERLTDEEWEKSTGAKAPARPTWLVDLVVD